MATTLQRRRHPDRWRRCCARPHPARTSTRPWTPSSRRVWKPPSPRQTPGMGPRTLKGGCAPHDNGACRWDPRHPRERECPTRPHLRRIISTDGTTAGVVY